MDDRYDSYDGRGASRAPGTGRQRADSQRYGSRQGDPRQDYRGGAQRDAQRGPAGYDRRDARPRGDAYGSRPQSGRYVEQPRAGQHAAHGTGPAYNSNTYSRQASQYARGNYGSHSSGSQRGGRRGSTHGAPPHGGGSGRRFDPKIFIASGIVLVFVIAVVIYFNTRPFDIIVDGRTVEVAYGTTYEDLHDKGLLTASNGNLIAVDKSVIAEGEGGSYKVYDENQEVSDLGAKVRKGSLITDADGDDLMEDYDIVETTQAHTTVIEGGQDYDFYDGILTMQVYPGRDGVTKTLTGKMSGKTALSDDSVTMVPRTYWALTPHITSEKVVCLTFDDGPSEYTQQIMDVLAKYGATATFFEIGLNIDDYASVTSAVSAAGYEVGSHSYAHPGVKYDKYYTDMSDAEVVADLKHNQELIKNATGKDVTVIRPPGGNMGYAALMAGADYITVAARWSIDTEDWSTPGTDTIVNNALANVTSGSVILMHDGGGDRTESVAALDTICAQLKADGYRFVTVSELAQLEMQKLKDDGLLDSDGIPTNTTATTTSSTGTAAAA